MNERNKTRWIIPEPIHIVERNEDSSFQKGASGTSGARPKRTAAEQQAIDQMKEITPEAVEVIHGILVDENAPLYTYSVMQLYGESFCYWLMARAAIGSHLTLSTKASDKGLDLQVRWRI